MHSAYFEDRNGGFTVFENGSVTHHHRDGGSFTELTKTPFVEFERLKRLEMREEMRGQTARELIKATVH